MVKKSQTTLDKEQAQLALCQQLIIGNSYRSQEHLKQAMQRHGYRDISQSTISRLLRLLGVVKVRNAKGQKIYALGPQAQPEPDVSRPIADMVVHVVHNDEFILVSVVSGYARAVARVIDHRALPEVLGVVATSNIVWIAPRDTRNILRLYRQILHTLELEPAYTE
ncbi:Arginine repressor [Dickeya dianthicola]|uniref:Arginine repressor n=1 Tax=Dickeya dianthicola TaxID=204039 RepID=A0AAP6RWZ5_9GAMM|nr:ArgR family transcriptional regulator [Dickeya dianthicola]ATO31330.1 Arginine pathway regulatory protein ArgR repressor of arg regulon [Dickeya dianthicola RNS04.9]AYC17321.1 Arginine repressor [Dickeya dianthicola]MBI0439665.1 ArgR family transcriptional regulator [Dickeya dianthicola]MBI0450085.1 ArgR family transcriptional regulator [Dickeya dianthicola]MBI0454698.1 ArgR family transcriptional regulator [Dickeya dianthicola]